MLDVPVSKNLKISGYDRLLFNHRGNRDINVFSPIILYGLRDLCVENRSFENQPV